jgi:hypothetical protein
MALDKTSKSDRSQTVKAVLFMGLFAAVLIIVALARNNESISLPGATPSGELVVSRITSACLDNEGLKISVVFDEPLTGTANIQVFTTGDDYFPSDQGISDSFRMNENVSNETDHLDILVPVDAMPVGEQVFGNIVVSDEDVSSFVAYSLNVSDCSETAMFPPDATLNEHPIIRSATCLPSQQLMIAFEFEGPVLGQYRVMVDEIPYRLASVINQPATLFFSGESPPEGPVEIRLISATDEVTVFEETYTPPVCGGN